MLIPEIKPTNVSFSLTRTPLPITIFTLSNSVHRLKSELMGCDELQERVGMRLPDQPWDVG